MSCLLGESEEALRRGPLTCCCWSGRRDSNPRPQPWQGDKDLRLGRLAPHKSRSQRCGFRPRPPQSLHPAAVDVTMDVTIRRPTEPEMGFLDGRRRLCVPPRSLGHSRTPHVTHSGVTQRHFRHAAGCSPWDVLGRAFGDTRLPSSAPRAVDQYVPRTHAARRRAERFNAHRTFAVGDAVRNGTGCVESGAPCRDLR